MSTQLLLFVVCAIAAVALVVDGWIAHRSAEKFKRIAKEAEEWNAEWDEWEKSKAPLPRRCDKTKKHVYAIFREDMTMRCAYCEAVADVVPRGDP